MTPHQPQRSTDGWLIGDDWLNQDDGEVTLTLTACRACGSHWFPPRDVCSACASSDVVRATSPSHGTVYASTLVRIGPAAFDPPYALSYVDIGPVRVLAHLQSELAVAPGTRVRLSVARIGADESGSLSSYVATPIPGAGGTR